MEKEKTISRAVADGGLIYEATKPQKKKLLQMMFALYEAGKENDDGKFFNTRTELLEGIHELQRQTAAQIHDQHNIAERLVAKIEGMAFFDPNEAGQFSPHASGYNQAIDEVLDVVKQTLQVTKDV